MNVYVFLGPTLSLDVARSRLPAMYLPPAAQGDVYRAAKERPFAIGLVDGYFERVPAVWHKEILWAMTQGVHVFGASSIGALRAAELAPFGMVGVGKVFEAFASGQLEDDDEVAVAHGDASTGYCLASDAMVNIRATLDAAERAGAVKIQLRTELESLAKRLFYSERSFGRVLALATERGAPSHEVDAVRAFVASHPVDQKREDALVLLETLAACVAAGTPPRPAKFSFSHTDAWARAVEWAERQPAIVEHAGIPASAMAAEVRLAGATGAETLARAWTRALADVLARQLPVASREERSMETDRSLRARFGPRDPAFDAWLAAQGLTRETYPGFLERQVNLAWARESFRDEVDRHVVDELRLRGDYAATAARVGEKIRLLYERGLVDASPSDAGVSDAELLGWYFRERLGVPVPDDLTSFASEVGASDVASLKREALQTFLHARIVAGAK